MSAQVQLDGGFYLWEIGFDEESFGLYTDEPSADAALEALIPDPDSPVWDGCAVRRVFVRTRVNQKVEPGPLTDAQWAEAFRRCAIIAEWRDLNLPLAATGPNNEAWCAESEKFDPVANALLLLDDEAVLRWNEDESWARKCLLRSDDGGE